MKSKKTQQKCMNSGESGRENKIFTNVSFRFTNTESTKLLWATYSLRRKRKGCLIDPESRTPEQHRQYPKHKQRASLASLFISMGYFLFAELGSQSHKPVCFLTKEL